MDSKLIISRTQIRAAGDAIFQVVLDKVKGHSLAEYAVNFVKGEFDTVGVDAAAQVLTDFGWNVTE